MTIVELEVGEIVTDGSGYYAEVKKCPHGNKYYAFRGPAHTLGGIDLSTVFEVADMDEDKIPCCS